MGVTSMDHVSSSCPAGAAVDDAAAGGRRRDRAPGLGERPARVGRLRAPRRPGLAPPPPRPAAAAATAAVVLAATTTAAAAAVGTVRLAGAVEEAVTRVTFVCTNGHGELVIVIITIDVGGDCAQRRSSWVRWPPSRSRAGRGPSSSESERDTEAAMWRSRWWRRRA